jgi:hypothetical protein
MFANLARRATSLSPLVENRTKISVGEIVDNYPEGITVNNFDMVNGTDQSGQPITYPVFTFAEDNTRFGFGGTVLKNIVNSWLAAFDGDIEACAKALNANGGVKLKFSHGRTKAGRTVTEIEVIG